jgi:hypothetical protein
MDTSSETNNETKKQSSQRRIEASRANGKKSRGPVTSKGKARSSQNARKHSILARHLCLSAQDEEIYSGIAEMYLNRFQPRDQAENDLVEQIVYCNFQMRQAWMQQASALGMQMAIDQNAVDSAWAAPSDNDRRVLALTASLKDTNVIPLLQRYARSLATQAERAAKQLIELQKLRIPPAPVAPELTADDRQLATIPNDPNPTTEQSSEDTELPTVIAYSLPIPRVARVHFPREQSHIAPQPALLARAA